MNHKKTAEDQSTHDERSEEMKTIQQEGANKYPVRPLVGPDGRVVGLITDHDICRNAALKVICTAQGPISDTGERIFPCKSNENVRAELNSLLGPAKVQVEVAGGILRHNIR